MKDVRLDSGRDDCLLWWRDRNTQNIRIQSYKGQKLVSIEGINVTQAHGHPLSPSPEGSHE